MTVYNIIDPHSYSLFLLKKKKKIMFFSSMILITSRDSVTAVSEFSINITKKSGAI